MHGNKFCANDSFTSFSESNVCILFFFLLLHLLASPVEMLNQSQWNLLPCHVLSLKGKEFSLQTLSLMLGMVFFTGIPHAIRSYILFSV